MNGYTMLADTYRKAGDEKKARIYDFLSSCTKDDICALYDSSAFNEICMSYVRRAVRELVAEDVLDEDQARAVRNRVSLLFSEKTAEDVCRD